MPTKGADECAAALKLAGVNVKIEGSALYDSQSNGLAESAVKDVKDAVRTNLACLFRRFGQEFQGRHPVLPLFVKYSVAMLNRCRKGPDGSILYRTNWWAMPVERLFLAQRFVW